MINPPPYSNTNITSASYEELKDKEKIDQLFSKIGYKLQNNIFDIIFDEASRDGRYCTVNDFRNVLNDYLNAKDFNKDNEWLRSRGK